MECKNCGSTNITTGVYFAQRDGFKSTGPIYKDSGFKHAEQALCDVCENCGEIIRLYVIPRGKRKWVVSDRKDLDYRDYIVKQKEKDLKQKEQELIEERVRYLSHLLMSDVCEKKYVRDLTQYQKHELYDYPVMTKGPMYRLYREIGSDREVMIKKVTMHLDKGNYLVCAVPLDMDEWGNY